MHREVLVGADEDSDEMTFKSANGTFSGIPTMCMWRDQLELNSALIEKIFHKPGAFVVEDLE